MEKVTVATSKIPEDPGHLRIAQISDVHIGLIVGERRIRKILDLVREAQPDILISTGDLVDGQIDSLSGYPGFFKEVRPRYGKFAITGNHEYYAGFAQAMDFTRESGFAMLRGQGITVGGVLNIVGVDDPAGERYGLFSRVNERELLSRFSNGKFTLLLRHRPILNEDTLGLFDLQLSGHAHKGQIFPFSLFTRMYYVAHAGFLRLSNGSSLYVSRGSGTWGPPIRFLAPPEVTLIELVHDKRFSG